jgi:hypothetical protein
MGCLGLGFIFLAIALSLFGGIHEAAYLALPGMVLALIEMSRKKQGQAASTQKTAEDRARRDEPAPRQRDERQEPIEPRPHAEENDRRGKIVWLSLNDIFAGGSRIKDQAQDEYKKRQRDRIDTVLGNKRRK